MQVFRTCYGQTPVIQERTVLVQTNFVSANDLVEKYGWDFVHPVLDNMTSAIINATRANNGTNRGVMHTGCFLTFRSVKDAIAAILEWHRQIQRIKPQECKEDDFQVRVAVHLGTLHLMKHTMLGKDIDLLRTLAPLGSGKETLLTSQAVDAAIAEGCAVAEFESVENSALRDCGSKLRWDRSFSHTPVFRLKH
jgi:hypothetical protein